MGGEQAASVLATLRRDNIEAARRDLERRGRGRLQGPDPRQVRTRGRPLLRHRAAVGRRHHRSGRHARRARPRHGRIAERADRGDTLRRVPHVMFRSLLIANRGEIACRIMRTAQRMGIRCIAVFSEADAQRPACRAGRRGASDRPGRRRATATCAPTASSPSRRPPAPRRSTRATASSPRTPISPRPAPPPASSSSARPPRAIRAMGSKAESKALMVAAGVPVVPGYHGEDQAEDRLAAEAARIGFPVLIKASAGGGGKGMRPVLSRGRFPRRTRRRAARGARPPSATTACCSNATCRSRAMWRCRSSPTATAAPSTCTRATARCSAATRRCSRKRPRPDLSPALRERLHAAAIAAARAVGYVNAGTVEFIVEGDDAFFMEMNTRLQVEHPVTEMITGLDLVEWQLRVAAGEPLPLDEAPEAERPCRRGAPLCRGSRRRVPALHRHARALLRARHGGEGVRMDTGVRAGDAITPHLRPDDREAHRRRGRTGARAGAARRRAGGHAARRAHDQPRLPAAPGRASGDAGGANSTPASSRAMRRS